MVAFKSHYSESEDFFFFSFCMAKAQRRTGEQ